MKHFRHKSAKIPVEGSDKPAVVDADNFEFLDHFRWTAALQDGHIHAAAEIQGQRVLMEDLVLWVALIQGQGLTATGLLKGKRPRHLSPEELRKALEAALARQTMQQALQEEVDKARAKSPRK